VFIIRKWSKLYYNIFFKALPGLHILRLNPKSIQTKYFRTRHITVNSKKNTITDILHNIRGVGNFNNAWFANSAFQCLIIIIIIIYNTKILKGTFINRKKCS